MHNDLINFCFCVLGTTANTADIPPCRAEDCHFWPLLPQEKCPCFPPGEKLGQREQHCELSKASVALGFHLRKSVLSSAHATSL